MCITPHTLFPRGVNWLADYELRIDSGPRTEFLNAPVVHFGDIKVSILIGAEAVHAPEAAGEISPGAKGVKEVAFQIVLQHFGCSAVERPQAPVGTDIDQVDVGGIAAHAEIVEELAVFVEDLAAMIGAVVHKNVARLRVERHAMDIVHVAGPG